MPLATRLKPWRGLIISVVVFALLVAGVAMLLGEVSKQSSEEQTTIIRSAVRRAALTCFAIEGRYPQTADYLEDNYGLMYDKDMYVVRYDAFASNIMPDIRVIRIGDIA